MTALLLAPLPLLIVLALVASAGLPWGHLAGDLARGTGALRILQDGEVVAATSLTVALLPLAAIYFWSMRQPRLVPAIAVFVAGLALDVVTEGPLGLWATAALVTGLAGRGTRRLDTRAGLLRRSWRAVAALSLATIAVAVLSSLWAWSVVPLAPYAIAAAVAILFYPLVSSLLGRLDRLWPAVVSRPLFIRGD